MQTNSSNTLKITEKRKLWLLIPAAVAVITAIMLVVYMFAASSPVNVGMDIAGGYYITIKTADVNDDNYSEFIERVERVACELTDENDEKYGLVIDSTTRIGTGANTIIYVNYKAVKGLSSTEMTELGESFEIALREMLTHIIPTVTLTGNEATISYDRTVATFVTNIENRIRAEYPSATLQWTNPAPQVGDTSDSEVPYCTELKVTNLTSASETALVEAATVVDEYAAMISEADTLSGWVSPDLINYTIAAGVIALVVAFIYMVIRMRKISAGISVALGLLLDVALMLCLMIIFHASITWLVSAAVVITMLFSMYNKMIVFVRIKENLKKNAQHNNIKQMSEIVDVSLTEILKRGIINLSCIALMTLSITVGAIIAGQIAVAMFAIPMVFGLIASSFTTVFISPCIWAMINKNVTRPKEKAKSKHKEVTTI